MSMRRFADRFDERRAAGTAGQLSGEE